MYRAMGIALHLLALSNLVSGGDMEDGTGSEKELREKAALLFSMRTVVDDKKRTLLHLASGSDACPLGRYPVTAFPSANVVRTLLRCGYNPNALDSEGNTPIHIVSTAAKYAGDKLANEEDTSQTLSNILDVITALIDKNGHADYRNYHGFIAMEILPYAIRSKVSFVKHESLKCLAARAVMVNNLNYQDHLPKSLWNFIAGH